MREKHRCGRAGKQGNGENAASAQKDNAEARRTLRCAEEDGGERQKGKTRKSNTEHTGRAEKDEEDEARSDSGVRRADDAHGVYDLIEERNVFGARISIFSSRSDDSRVSPFCSVRFCSPAILANHIAVNRD